MPTVTIRIDGLKEALDALAIPESEMVARAGKAAALATIAVAKPEPPASRKKQPFKSAASRRAFFAGLRKGTIRVPYQRSHELQDAWDWKPAGDGAEVFNSSGHAAFTVDRATRTKYHKGGPWKDEHQIAQQATPEAQDAAERAILDLVASKG